MSNRPTSEALNFAADYLQEHGWIGSNRPPGYDTWGYRGEGAAVCIEGAIFAAIGRPTEAASADLNDCPAGAAVREHLAIRGDWPLYVWNDDLNRTATEVIEVLRATAVIEAARESTARTDDAARRVGIKVAGL